ARPVLRLLAVEGYLTTARRQSRLRVARLHADGATGKRRRIGRKRYLSDDRRSLARLRLDREIPGNELQAFSHAGQTETAVLRNGFGIESASAIAHDQTDSVRCSAEVDRKTDSAAVPYRILQRFLQHSKETERDVGPHRSRHVLVAEVDLNSLTSRDLRTETSDRRNDPDHLQFGRVQFVR